MKNILIIILLSVFSPYTLSAQVAYMEEKAKVNKIKRNSQYLYGEGVAATLDEAMQLAEQNLKNAILAEMSENEELQDADKVLVNSIKKHSEKIQLKRGTMERVFLYVEKKNLYSANRMVSLDVSASVQPSAVDTLSVRPDKNDSIVTQNMHVKESSGLAKEKPEDKVEPVFESVTKPVLSSTSSVAVPSSALESILSQKTAAGLESMMRKLKDEHKLMWGNVRSSVNPQWYVVVLSGNDIKAVLDREGQGKRTNLLTGEEATLGDYASDVKVWFILYE